MAIDWGDVATFAGPIVAGGIGYAGQESTNAANALEAQKNRNFAAEQADINRTFQADQSATEIQRRVADLKAAGLNPALAYGQGGASSGSGSAASGTPARFDSSAGAAVNSASSVSNFVQSAATQSAQREQIMAGADFTRAQAAQIRLESAARLGELQTRSQSQFARASRDDVERVIAADLYPYRARLMEAQRKQSEAGGFSALQSARESKERTRLYGPQRRLLEAQIPMAENIGRAADTWFMRNVAPYLGSARQIGGLLSPFAAFGALRKFGSGFKSQNPSLRGYDRFGGQ